MIEKYKQNKKYYQRSSREKKMMSTKTHGKSRRTGKHPRGRSSGFAGGGRASYSVGTKTKQLTTGRLLKLETLFCLLQVRNTDTVSDR